MIPDRVFDLYDQRILECGAAGPRLSKAQDALDIIGNALQSRARWVLLPVERIDAEFFDLKSGLAGEAVQKFANYHLSLAVVGDLSAQIARSSSLRDFVREANAGKLIWFLGNREDFEERLKSS